MTIQRKTTRRRPNPAAPTFNKLNARNWCRRHADTFRDRRTGEVDSTALAEACAAHFDVDGLRGPLDDPDHWIWDVAIVD